MFGDEKMESGDEGNRSRLFRVGVVDKLSEVGILDVFLSFVLLTFFK
jgi:hypothetical protein